MTFKTINREQFDKLGNVIREWLEEEGFETNVQQELDLENRILNCLSIGKRF